MKNLKRQDRAGTRTSEDLRRRYKLNEIELTKDEIEYLKQFLEVDATLSTSSIRAVQNKIVTAALNTKVNKEPNKGLSSNDFTNVLLDKLNAIEENAQENIIESISVNGVVQEIEEKNINLQSLSLLDVYPVGSIYMSVMSANPSTLFGGEWEAWGTGRVPVGIDTTQTEFDTVEKTGGEKDHTLTLDEMPNHAHSVANYNAGGYDLTTSPVMLGEATKGWTGNAFTTYEGGGEAHNNLPPYITCYMWKRTK